MFLPFRRGCSVWDALARFSPRAWETRSRNFSLVRSSSLSRLPGCRIEVVLSDAVALDRAGHAAGTAPAAAEFAAGDGDDLDAVIGEHGVGDGVALVADDDTGSDREEVVGIVPLFALGGAG